jgi:hypothetical protein
MFLPFLFSASASVSIAPSPGQTAFKPLPLSEVEAVLNKTDLLIGLAAKPRDSQLIARFFDAQSLFPDAHFELFTPLDFKKVVPKVPRSPYLVLFEGNELKALVGQIDSETTLAFLLDLYVTKSRPVIDSLEGALFGAPVTIIARPDQFEAAYNLSLLAGPANVVTVTERIATELGFNQSECALFRKDDLAFATFACRPDGYKANIAPKFAYYDEKQLKHSRDLIFAFHSKEPEENVTEFLTQLGKKYRDFRFVYAPRGETYVLTDFLRVVFHHPYTHIAVINFSARFHYDLSSLVTREQFDEEPFNATVWRRRIHRIVKAVRNGELPKIYQSDYETDPEAGNIQSVVGTNYGKYVLNESVDTFVFYHKPTCPTCMSVFRNVFRPFANAVEKYSNLSYQFVHIDTSSNRVPEGFPVWKTGTIALFPAPWNQVKVLPLEKYEVLLWFAHKYASVRHPIPFELPDNETLDQIQERIDELSLYMNEDNRAVLRAVMIDIKADIYMRDLYRRNPDADKPWPKRENETKQRIQIFKPEVLEEFAREEEARLAAEAAEAAKKAAQGGGESSPIPDTPVSGDVEQTPAPEAPAQEL